MTVSRRTLHLVLLATILPVVLLGAVPADEADLPVQAAVSAFKGYAQSASLSCESRSAVDWAAFWGITIPEYEFQARLPRSDDPNLGFVGSPYDPWGNIPPYSYGVHAAPVAALLGEYGLSAEARHGLEWDDLRREIAANRPVIVWVISEMWSGRPVGYTTQAGETVTVAAFEHTMVLTGYTENTVTLVDAYSGSTKTFSLSAFLKSWSVLENMAVTWLSPEPLEPPESPEPQISEDYTVQNGEYLHAISSRRELSWQAVAGLNQLVFPYALEPGQVLRLQGPETGGPLLEPAADPTDWPADQYPFIGPPLPQVKIYLALLMRALDKPDAEDLSSGAELGNEPDMPEIYIVQPGDYLTAIADRFGLSWQALADLNGIAYPYTVYPGQALKLPPLPASP